MSPNYNDNTSILIKKPTSDNNERKNAVTKYRVIDTANEAALLEVQPKTGIEIQ